MLLFSFKELGKTKQNLRILEEFCKRFSNRILIELFKIIYKIKNPLVFVQYPRNLLCCIVATVKGTCLLSHIWQLCSSWSVSCLDR